jgi:sRNA-binding carbon storage regulator CsrA
MIVFSRLVGEALVIGDVAEVTVARITIDSVGLMAHMLADGAEQIEMLQLGEKMELDGEIRVTVVDIDVTTQRKKIRIGIEAPRNMPVYRKEMLPPYS